MNEHACLSLNVNAPVYKCKDPNASRALERGLVSISIPIELLGIKTLTTFGISLLYLVVS